MDNLNKINVTQGSQLQVDGLKALRDRLGVVDTLKFLEEYDNGGSGDFTKEKYEQEDTLLTKDAILKMFQ